MLLIPDERFSDVARWYQVEGMSLKDVSKRLGCCEATVWLAFRKRGVGVRPTGKNRVVGHPELSSKSWLTHKYCVERLNMAQIGRLVGLTGKAVEHWLDRYGISHIRRIGEAHPGFKKENRVVCEDCRGRLYRTAARRHGKIFCRRRGSKHRRGRNNVNYAPPHLRKTDESRPWRQRVQFREWRKSVFTRDDYHCRRRGQTSRHLRPHHIYNFSDIRSARFLKTNGVTLCDSCHVGFHSRYGSKGNDVWQLLHCLNNDKAASGRLTEVSH